MAITKKIHKCDEHFEQLADIRSVHTEALAEARALRESQVQMTGLLQSLDTNIKQGLSVAQSVIKVFSQVVFVFLVVVLGLCAVIVWVSQINVEYDDKGFKVTQHPSTHP